MQVWVRRRFAGITHLACAVGCAGALAWTSACAHPQAQVTAIPPLDVPLPPPRVIEAVEVDAPAPVGAPVAVPGSLDEPVRPPSTGGRGSRPPAAQLRTDAPKPAEPPKPDPAVVATDPPKPAEEPRPQAPSLQTAPAQREAQVEARVRSVMTRAAGILNKIDYRTLGADAREQYDTAKRWIQLAEDELKARNLPYAESLADKAATLATQLASR